MVMGRCKKAAWLGFNSSHEPFGVIFFTVYVFFCGIHVIA
jgi:hypothetical protein